MAPPPPLRLNWFGSFLNWPRDIPPPFGRFCGASIVTAAGEAEVETRDKPDAGEKAATSARARAATSRDARMPKVSRSEIARLDCVPGSLASEIKISISVAEVEILPPTQSCEINYDLQTSYTRGLHSLSRRSSYSALIGLWSEVTVLAQLA